MTRRSVLSVVCLLNSCLLAMPEHSAGAVMRSWQMQPNARPHTERHVLRATPRRCERSTRSVNVLPAPLVGFEAPYAPSACDPLRLLPKQAWRMFACVRWREGGDTPDQPNGAGMYQFTNRATWNEFRGNFAEVPSDATALQQDVVAYRAWKTEQFLPWNGDPCLGAVHQIGKWGWY